MVKGIMARKGLSCWYPVLKEGKFSVSEGFDFLLCLSAAYHSRRRYIVPISCTFRRSIRRSSIGL